MPLEVTAVDETGRKLERGVVEYSMDNCGKKTMARGRVDLSKANPFIVNATLDCPGVARLKFKSQDDAEFVWGVAFSPDRIRTGGKRPADFDSFWMNAKAEYDRTVPVDVKLERLPRFCTTGQNAYRLSLTTPHGRIIDGVLTEPSDLDKGPYPVRLYVPGAGPSTGCPDESDGKIRLTMNVHYYPLVVGKMKRSKGNDELRVRDKREFDVYREKYGSTANCRKRPNTAATHPNTAGRFGAPRCRVGTPPLTSGMRQSEFQAVSL